MQLSINHKDSTVRVRNDSQAVRIYSLTTSVDGFDERIKALVLSGNFIRVVARYRATRHT